MKNYLLALTIFMPATLLAQINKHDWWVGGSYDHISFSEFPEFNTVGIKGEYMLGKVVGVEFGFTAGKDNIHLGAGTILGPIFLLMNSKNNNEDSEGGGLAELAFMVIAIASMAEHTNYHIRITDGLQLVPFLSLLRYRYMYDRTDPYYPTTDFLSWSVGTKLSLITKKNWIINASFERSQLYYTGTPSGMQAGINVGYIFKHKGE
jgi:Outer membrane protein beta-barrel domain